jgi:hypothetical protein
MRILLLALAEGATPIRASGSRRILLRSGGRSLAGLQEATVDGLGHA